MRIAGFTGSRYDWDISPEAQERIKAIIDVAAYVHVGDAEGLDAFVRNECQRSGTAWRAWIAQWGIYGREAGPKRNQAIVNMLVDCKQAGHTVGMFGFPGPNSKGTWDCLKRAYDAGLMTRVWLDGELVNYQPSMDPRRKQLSLK